MLKILKSETSKILRSLKEFPPFKVSATEYVDGTIERKVSVMKKDTDNNNFAKYVMHKELKAELSNFVTKIEFNEFRKEVNDRFVEVNKKFDQVNNKVDLIAQRLEELIKLIVNK